MDVLLASKAFPSPSHVTSEQLSSKQARGVIDDLKKPAKNTDFNPNVNDVSCFYSNDLL
jgi:hypothetical protein